MITYPKFMRSLFSSRSSLHRAAYSVEEIVMSRRFKLPVIEFGAREEEREAVEGERRLVPALVGGPEIRRLPNNNMVES